jgi:hypothetical protein
MRCFNIFRNVYVFHFMLLPLLLLQKNIWRKWLQIFLNHIYCLIGNSLDSFMYSWTYLCSVYLVNFSNFLNGVTALNCAFMSFYFNILK